jgi:hypothetical protein
MRTSAPSTPATIAVARSYGCDLRQGRLPGVSLIDGDSTLSACVDSTSTWYVDPALTDVDKPATTRPAPQIGSGSLR